MRKELKSVCFWKVNSVSVFIKIFPHAEGLDSHEIKEKRDGYFQKDLDLLHLVVMEVTILISPRVQLEEFLEAGEEEFFYFQIYICLRNSILLSKTQDQEA